MKNILHLIIGILGAGLLGYSLFQGWYELQLSNNMGSFNLVNIGAGKAGYETWQGLAAGGLGLVTLILVFLKKKLGAATGLAGAACAACAYFMYNSDDMTSKTGVWMAVGGCVLLAIGALLAPKR